MDQYWQMKLATQTIPVKSATGEAVTSDGDAFVFVG